MARKVKISVLAADKPHVYQGRKDALSAVANMKEYWDKQLQQAVNEKADIVLLPEDCDRFSDMEASIYPEYNRIRLLEMPMFFKNYAKINHLGILHSSLTEKANRTVAYDREGNMAGFYDKVFPTIWEIEDGIIPGIGAKTFAIDQIKKAGFAICFDLNFDELRQQYIEQKPEVMFFSSMFHGGLQQQTWAYSTRAFFVSSIFGNQSRIMAPNGTVLASTSNHNNHCCATVNLDSRLIHLDYNMVKFDAIKKKYRDQFVIDDTGYLASVMIYNEMDDITIDDIIREFQLETLDNYFNRSRDKRNDSL
ncbi:MAG: carbon-nitrogen hydrolase family protein [Clostridia bacterium]|nr:carbon-nitrogen hydrolase family protein [Clostridia bacterium]